MKLLRSLNRSLLAPIHEIFRQYPRQFSAVTASMVKELREKSGAPMMDCKKALSAEEVGGDFAKAMDWLRAKGIAKAQSNAGRQASEGLIALILGCKSTTTLVEINSETDFVARNADFQSLVARVAFTANSLGGAGPVDIDALLKTPAVDIKDNASSGRMVEDFLTDAITSIRENIVIRRVENFPFDGSVCIGGYVHGKVSSVYDDIQLGNSAALVLASHNQKSQDKVQNICKKLAMHVVAAKPLYLDTSQVPSNFIAREMEVFKQAMQNDPKESHKKPEIIEKMLKGKLNKRLADVCLLGQNHVAEESSPVISKFIAEVSKKEGLELKIDSFSNWKLGDE